MNNLDTWIQTKENTPGITLSEMVQLEQLKMLNSINNHLKAVDLVATLYLIMLALAIIGVVLFIVLTIIGVATIPRGY